MRCRGQATYTAAAYMKLLLGWLMSSGASGRGTLLSELPVHGMHGMSALVKSKPVCDCSADSTRHQDKQAQGVQKAHE